VEIRYENVGKHFEGVDALSDFSVTVPDGSFLVLLGPSGCGKTTAMRIAAGLELPTAGRVYIGDRDVTDLSPRDRDIAMVFQSYALYPHMRVRENIAYPLKIRKVSKAEVEERVTRVAEVLDLMPYLDRRPRQLSGGQRQRVALARAMIRQPVGFLMDEPLSNLDAQLRSHMRTEIKRLQREFSVTTLYVTHDQVEAMTMADNVAVLRHGLLQQLATPQVLYAEPANTFVATFVGSPPMNILQGVVQEGTFRCMAGSFASPAVHNGEVQAGFRPESVTLVDPTSETADLRLAVYAVEPLGNEVIAAFQFEGQLLHARLSPDVELAVGQNVGMRVDPRKTHLFHADSGERISSTRSSAQSLEKEWA
jgi:multiple sugar transport system ATP-binding protein